MKTAGNKTPPYHFKINTKLSCENMHWKTGLESNIRSVEIAEHIASHHPTLPGD